MDNIKRIRPYKITVFYTTHTIYPFITLPSMFYTTAKFWISTPKQVQTPTVMNKYIK